MTGFYAFQVEDDELLGVPIPPDGRRLKNFQLGPILNYDMPERMASVKVKAITTLVTENTVESWAVVAGWAKKFRVNQLLTRIQAEQFSARAGAPNSLAIKTSVEAAPD